MAPALQGWAPERRIMTQTRQPEYMQSITINFEGVIEKGGVLLGETKEKRPILIFSSGTYPFLGAVPGDAAVVKDTKRFVDRMEKEWRKSGRKNQSGITVTVNQNLKDKMEHKDDMPKFGEYLNVPITLQRGKPGEKFVDSPAFLSMSFPSQEMLSIGGGQPKVIITKAAEPESRIGERLDEMAQWVTKRLATAARA